MLHQSRASHFSLLANPFKYFIEFVSVDSTLLAKFLLLESVQSLSTRLWSSANAMWCSKLKRRPSLTSVIEYINSPDGLGLIGD